MWGRKAPAALLVLGISIFLCLSPLAIVAETAAAVNEELEDACIHGDGGECIDQADAVHNNASEIAEGDDEEGGKEGELVQSGEEHPNGEQTEENYEEEEENYGDEEEDHFDDEEEEHFDEEEDDEDGEGEEEEEENYDEEKEEEYDDDGGEGEEDEDEEYDGEGQGDDEYDEDEECQNLADDCFSRSLNDGCILDFEHMVEDCRLTCYFCSPEYTLERIYNIYSLVPQQLYNSQPLADYVETVDEYMYDSVYRSDLSENIKLSCKNKDSQCSHWAHGGECELNEQFMLDRCAAACMACEGGQSYESRCPFDQNTPVIWQPGDVNEMFTRLVTLPEYYGYLPTTVSRPIANPNSKFDEVDGPWIVVLDDFLSDEDCDTLLKLAEEEDFEKRAGSEDDSSEVQRSFSARLCQGECADSGIVGYIEEQIEFISGVPPQHTEPIEFIKYEQGDFYDVHSEYLPLEYSRVQGPRIFSVIVFLNDFASSGKEGEDFNGGIEFSYVDTTVGARRGRAIIFPNVLDGYPMARDIRTEHSAVPVIDGSLYTLNIRSHQRDYKTPLEKSCTT